MHLTGLSRFRDGVSIKIFMADATFAELGFVLDGVLYRIWILLAHHDLFSTPYHAREILRKAVRSKISVYANTLYLEGPMDSPWRLRPFVVQCRDAISSSYWVKAQAASRHTPCRIRFNASGLRLINYRPEITYQHHKAMKNHTDLLVSYSWGRFPRVRNEIIAILAQFGDPAPVVDRTAVFGIAFVRTALNNRAVIRQCQTLWQEAGSRCFQFAIKWVPVDYWCETDLDAIKQLIDSKLKNQIKANQTWGMVVKRRRYQKHHTSDIVRYLAQDIDRKVNLNEPDWIVWIDIIGKQTAIALLTSDDIFSIGVSSF